LSLEHYITLFDSVFLPQGLALHASLKRHAGSFKLWVLCMDERAKEVLDRLGEPTIRAVALADVETPELLEVKPGRNRAEYCWTMTPFTPTIVFDRDPEAKRVTYVDADVFLLKSPQPVFEEFERSGKAVLITEHAYDPEYDQTAASGQFCVQFVTFVRGASEPVRQWWQDRCIEWCFDRIEEGRLGDQKYLDQWPIRFGGLVHILGQIDAFLAPWNARRFPYSKAVAWHFHGLRLLKDGKILFHGPYSVPDVVHRMVYVPYAEELARSLNRLGEEIVQGRARRWWLSWIRSLIRNVKGVLREMRNHHAVWDMPKADNRLAGKKR
jgi:hypothetical protein